MTNQDSSAQKHNNQLINETSPYLLQHAHNPVDWYPYGDAAFEKAKKENKLILFSIGYAACHWCHVMEHESFESEAVAEIMNQHFVCVKVDREERPDVDQIYMNAVQILTGSGGWPLNCFALPDGRPVWGGTYFRPKDWSNILESLASGYRNDPQKFERAAKELTRGIGQSELIQNKSEAAILSPIELEQAVKALKQRFDYKDGGFIGHPKFPMPGIYEMLMDYALVQNDEALLKHISFTLKKWAYGGIYDQVGGGFSRYSVDSQWLVPHFEKMLYDNGQIIGLYAKMYRVTKEPVFKRIIEESITWLKNDMTDKNGLFYASYDADSEGEEGLFYVWKKEEIENLLKDDSKSFIEYYGISKSGNFEGSNILNVSSMDEPSDLIQTSKKQLYEHREKRIKPGLDNKTLSGWNALSISGLCESYWALGKDEYLEMALKAAHKIKTQNISNDGSLLRLFKKTESVHGFLEDYSLIIKAFLDLYDATNDSQWLETAYRLQSKTDELFLDANSGMYYYTAVGENVILRKMETTDNVIPASNSVMAHNLLRLSVYNENDTLRERAVQMGRNAKKIASQSPSYAYLWLNLYHKLNSDKKEIVIVGENAQKDIKTLNKDYYPNTIIVANDKENESRPLFKDRWQNGKTLFYYCVNNTCQLPVENIDKLKALVK